MDIIPEDGLEGEEADQEVESLKQELDAISVENPEDRTE